MARSKVLMWGGIALLYLATVVLLCLVTGAHATNVDGRYDNSPHRAWFSTQTNQYGQICCSTSDAYRYDGEYSLNSDGSVTLADGTVVEAKKVLNTPNIIGQPLWWHIGKTTYCFMPGAGI